MMVRRIVLILLFAWVGVLGVNARQPDQQTLFLTFIPNIQFAPIYMAGEKGYFAENNLTVTFEYGDENVGVDMLAINQRQFGIISGEEVIKSRAAGRPLVSVFEWFQKYPVGIVYPDNSGIESLADLKGRKVGIPGRFGASYNGLIAILAANDLVEADIQLEPIGFNAADVFCVGGVEASVVYVSNEPLQIQQRADAGQCNGISGVSVFPVADSADMVSNGLVTNEETLNNNPDLVQRMVNAYHLGLQSAINNPAETYLLSANQVENLPLDDAFRAALEAASVAQAEFLATNPDREAVAASRDALWQQLTQQFDSATLLQFRVLLNSIELWDADVLGYADESSWITTQEVLTTMGFVTTPIDVTAAFTNQFLPQSEG
ncbi:MAG: ABC transporter substrate-binding protein [Anaerolineae bacterium]|nr:ABC transporter substrate-binding protein [Anaerolineae bacterium]MBN8617769.1 ABC transporter substrate-binding protein [Anaerolineae bacterium]